MVTQSHEEFLINKKERKKEKKNKLVDKEMYNCPTQKRKKIRNSGMTNKLIDQFEAIKISEDPEKVVDCVSRGS